MTVDRAQETIAGVSAGDQLWFQQRPLAAAVGTGGPGASVEAGQGGQLSAQADDGGLEDAAVDRSPSLPGISSCRPGIPHLPTKLKK